MTIIQLVLLLVCMGIGLWAINRYLPLDPTIKKIINVVVIIIAIIVVLYAFGILPIHDAKVPHIAN